MALLVPDVGERTKACRRCLETKPASAFYLSTRRRDFGALSAQCKPCQNKSMQEWRRQHPERAREIALKHWRANRERYRVGERARSRRRLYGVSPEVYAAMLNDQAGVCAICRKPERTRERSGVTRSLAVDHDHRTGKVRGLLCWRCNTVIGRTEESVTILNAAADYLRSHSEA